MTYKTVSQRAAEDFDQMIRRQEARGGVGPDAEPNESAKTLAGRLLAHAPSTTAPGGTPPIPESTQILMQRMGYPHPESEPTKYYLRRPVAPADPAPAADLGGGYDDV